MRKMKWILGGLFAFTVALLVAGYIVITNYPVEDLKALIQQQAYEVTGRKLEIRGGAKLDVSFSPSIVLEDVHLENAPGAEGDMVSMGRFEMQVGLWPLLSEEIRIERFVLVDAVIALDRNAEGRGNWEMGDLEKAKAAADQTLDNLPSFQSVQFQNTRVTYRDAATGETRSLQLDTLEAQGRDLVSPIAVQAAGNLDTVPFDLAIDLGSVEQMASGTAFPLTLKGSLAEAEFAANGSVAPPGGTAGNDLTLSASGASLANLGLLAGMALPEVGPYTLKAHLVQRGQVYSLNDLTLTAGSSDLAGNLTADLAGERPLVKGALTAKRLVVTDFVGAPPVAQGESGLFSAEPLPLELLRSLDAQLALNAEELVWRTIVLKQAVMTVALQDGRLEITPLSAGYGDGSAAGAIVLDASQSPPALAVQLKGSGLDTAEASGGLVTGSLALDLDLTARGDSPKAWASSLTGRSEVSSGKGRINGELSTLASLGNIFGPLFGGSSEVTLNCLVNRMAWTDGIGTNEGTALDTNSFSVIGNGTVNLKNETIDFYVDTWSKDTALLGVAVPVTVRGSLTNPSVSPDAAGTALGLAKTAGLIIFPPAGLAAIISDRAASQQGNACVAVTDEVAAKGGPDAFFEGIGKTADDIIKGAGDAADDIGEAADDVGDAIEKGAEDAVEGLKSIFN